MSTPSGPTSCPHCAPHTRSGPPGAPGPAELPEPSSGDSVSGTSGSLGHLRASFQEQVRKGKRGQALGA